MFFSVNNLKAIVFPLLNPLSPIVSRHALALLLVLHCIFRPFRPFLPFRPFIPFLPFRPLSPLGPLKVPSDLMN